MYVCLALSPSALPEVLDFLGASAVVVWDHMAKTDAGEVSCASARCAADED